MFYLDRRKIECLYLDPRKNVMFVTRPEEDYNGCTYNRERLQCLYFDTRKIAMFIPRPEEDCNVYTYTIGRLQFFT